VELNNSRPISIGTEADHGQFFVKMASVMNEVMWISDLNKQKIIYISPGYERVWGLSCQSVYDSPMSFVNAIHPDDRDRVVAAFAKQKDGTYNETYRIIRPNGELRWIHDRSYPPSAIESGIVCVMGVAQDITEQKEVELALVATEERFRAIIEASPVPMALNNEKLEITLLNPAFVRTFGYTLKDLPTLEDWWPKAYPNPQYRKQVADKWNAEIELNKKSGGSFTPMEINICCKDGSFKNVLVNAAPLQSGFKGNHLVILHDITDLKRAESERESLRVQVIHASKMASLGELAAGIAHEINNPLAIVEGAASLLLKIKDSPEKFEPKVEAIKKACMRMGRIVGGLKKFSRSSENLSFKKTSLSEIVKEALVLTSVKSKRNQAEVNCDFKSDSYILADEVSIEQVIINLINNALDAVNDQAEKWVRVEVSEDTLHVILKITDSGSGIPPEIQAKIFNPFFTSKPVGEGTGLGLSICKGLLDEHKATIELIKDSPNTCFEVRFPKISSDLGN
jgi:PAS domain S-box-containing protein